MFERRVFQDNGDGTTSFGRIDCYKRDCFVLEAKQGSEGDRAAAARDEQDLDLFGQTAAVRVKRGTATRGTPGWIKAMTQAKGQAERYAKALPLDHGWPPFLLVCDVGYGVQYDGVEIEQLSPGTRGIVLLLLYLAIDQDDDRPLIIDQPEENLDPRSIFVELVEHFRQAKLRRQIIIVTHNANLVVNTDADQVIVATCGRHIPGQLPAISYAAGGLENATVRQAVCEILEGGEAAFRERARRLRLSI